MSCSAHTQWWLYYICWYFCGWFDWLFSAHIRQHMCPASSCSCDKALLYFLGRLPLTVLHWVCHIWWKQNSRFVPALDFCATPIQAEARLKCGLRILYFLKVNSKTDNKRQNLKCKGRNTFTVTVLNCDDLTHRFLKLSLQHLTLWHLLSVVCTCFYVSLFTTLTIFTRSPILLANMWSKIMTGLFLFHSLQRRNVKFSTIFIYFTSGLIKVLGTISWSSSGYYAITTCPSLHFFNFNFEKNESIQTTAWTGRNSGDNTTGKVCSFNHTFISQLLVKY